MSKKKIMSQLPEIISKGELSLLSGLEVAVKDKVTVMKGKEN